MLLLARSCIKFSTFCRPVPKFSEPRKKRPLNVMKTRMSKGYGPIEIATARITANGHHGPSPPGLSGMNPKNSTVVETRRAEAQSSRRNVGFKLNGLVV